MQAYLVPCWWVSWWLWGAGCISQDTYLLYDYMWFLHKEKVNFIQLRESPILSYCFLLLCHKMVGWPILFFAKFVELLSNNILSYVKDKCQDHEGISPGPRLLQKCVFCGWQIIIETPAPPPANSFWKNLKIFSFLRKIPSQELAITCSLIGQSVCQTTWILGLCPLMWAKLTCK